MRVLWVKVGGLWPPNTGGRLRSFHMLRELSRHHQTVLLTTHGADDDVAGLTAELASCERVESLPYSAPRRGSRAFVRALAGSWLTRDPVDIRKWRVRAVRRRVDELLAAGGFDVVVADFLLAVGNLPSRSPVPVVFFAHNVEHHIWRRLRDVERRWLPRLLLEVEWRKMRRSERRAVHDCALTVAVSESDRANLLAAAPSARIVAVPTGVDVEYFRPSPGPGKPNHLVFSGSMDWFPNEDAVVYFVEAILPRIRQARPDVTLTVVGRRPGGRIAALADGQRIHVTGTVDDVRPYVSEAAVYIVPLRVGGGTRIKIFEALAMGKAVVSTTIGAEGLDVVSGTQIEIADQPDAFAEAVVSLLEDPVRRASLAAAGRQLVEARFGWPSVTRVFEGHLVEAVTARQGRGAAGERERPGAAAR